MGQYGKYGPLVIRAAHAFAVALFVTCAMPAQAVECRLGLLLAIDVSSSVDANEDVLQRGGLARALLAPDVRKAFLSSDLPVALAVFEWSGRYNQEVILDWVLIRHSAALGFASEQIASSQRSHNEFPTAMGHALGFGATFLRRAPNCLSYTIDMAADGINNEGFPPKAAYREYPFDGVTVNGLAVNAADFEAEVDLLDFFEQQVLHGPGAFLIVANSFEDFEDAMERKLVRELQIPTLGALEQAHDRPPG